MDPNACFERFTRALEAADFDAACDARADLLAWLASGGFAPAWPDGWSDKRLREWSAPDPLDLDALQTVALSLENHARYCDRRATKLWEQQSSDLSYEHNVHCTSQASRYREQARDCKAVLTRVRTMIEALRVD